MAFLEDPADREVDTALSSRTHTTGDGDRAHHRIGNDAEIERAPHDDCPGITAGHTKGGSRLVPSSPVNFLSYELGQTVEFAAKTERGVSVVVAEELVGKISTEAKGSAEFEHLEWAGVAAKRGSSG